MKDGQRCGEAPLLWFVISIIVYLVIYLFVLVILLHNIKNSTIHNFNVHGRKEEEKLTLPATYSKQIKCSVNFNNHKFHKRRQHKIFFFYIYETFFLNWKTLEEAFKSFTLNHRIPKFYTNNTSTTPVSRHILIDAWNQIYLCCPCSKANNFCKEHASCGDESIELHRSGDFFFFFNYMRGGSAGTNWNHSAYLRKWRWSELCMVGLHKKNSKKNKTY